MRAYWEQTEIGRDYDPNALDQLHHILFMKRKTKNVSASAAQPGGIEDGDDEDMVFAAQEETGKAILGVLRLREAFLKRKGITEKFHILTSDERKEIVKAVREDYENTPEQRKLQAKDAENWTWGSKPKRSDYIRQQKRKRWCRHLQRTCGSKQVWEVLAFTGSFDVNLLEFIQRRDSDTHAEARLNISKEERIAGRRAKAEARATFNEASRLAALRDQQCTADLDTFSKCQLDLLMDYDSGLLRRKWNQAITNCGHGRLVSETGEIQDIGGNTGGAFRRLIEGWFVDGHSQ